MSVFCLFSLIWTIDYSSGSGPKRALYIHSASHYLLSTYYIIKHCAEVDTKMKIYGLYSSAQSLAQEFSMYNEKVHSEISSHSYVEDQRERVGNQVIMPGIETKAREASQTR